MNLSDLFITYNQVSVPEEKEEITKTETNETTNKYDQYLQYIDELKTRRLDTNNQNNQTDDTSVYDDSQYFTDDTSVYDDSQDVMYEFTDDNQQEEIFDLSIPILTQQDQNNFQTNKAKFDKDLNAFLNTPEYIQYKQLLDEKPIIRKILTRIAFLESSFDSNVDRTDSNAIGYFNITPVIYNETYGYTKNQFKNNLNIQFKVAIDHLIELDKIVNKWVNSSQVNKTVSYRTKNNGVVEELLTPFQLLYGLWWGPLATQKYMNYDDSYKDITDADRTNLKNIFKKSRTEYLESLNL